MNNLFKDWGSNGAVLTLGVVGLVALGGLAAQRAGGSNKIAFRGDITGVRVYGKSPKRKRSTKRRRKRSGSKKSAYNQFIGRRVKQLYAQGYEPSKAMSVAASEWRAR